MRPTARWGLVIARVASGLFAAIAVAWALTGLAGGFTLMKGDDGTGFATMALVPAAIAVLIWLGYGRR